MRLFAGSTLILADEPTSGFHYSRFAVSPSRSRCFVLAVSYDNDRAMTWCQMAHEYAIVDDVENDGHDKIRSDETSICSSCWMGKLDATRRDSTRQARSWTDDTTWGRNCAGRGVEHDTRLVYDVEAEATRSVETSDMLVSFHDVGRVVCDVGTVDAIGRLTRRAPCSSRLTTSGVDVGERWGDLVWARRAHARPAVIL